MARLRQEMDRLWSGVERPFTVYPAMNIFDNGESFIARSELPGVSPETLDISVTGNNLTIKGERKPYAVGEGVSYHRRECDHGMFNRSFQLPELVDSSKVKATYRHGVLEVLMPKAEAAKSRKVAIETHA